MRLWHKDIIDVLPRQQLLSQWRELCSLFVKENRHVLVNFVWNEYPLSDLLVYTKLILNEFEKRGYNISQDSRDKMELFFKNHNVVESDSNSVYSNKMNKLYLKQCLYNLEEKAMCNAIPIDEWLKIYNKFKYDFELWGEDYE